MPVQALFGLSVLTSFVAFGIVAKIYIAPRLKMMCREDPSLPGRPAYVPVCGLELSCSRGRVAGFVTGLRRSRGLWRPNRSSACHYCHHRTFRARRLGNALVWLFNIWGAGDLLYAFYQGLIGAGIDPATLGAAFYVPTLIVPPLLVTHAMIFWLLLRTEVLTRP